METHKQALEQAHEDSKNATYIIGRSMMVNRIANRTERLGAGVYIR